MNTFTRLALLCALGPLATGCLENRPVIVAESDAGNPGVSGNAGMTGSAGVTGSAGATGDAGTTGGSGSTGTAGTVAPGCDVAPLVTKYFCTLAGACHDAHQSATGLDMTSAGWAQKLVGTFPSNGSQASTASLCLGAGEPYLIEGSVPARGLFLDKLRPEPQCGMQMPILPPYLSPADMDCFQRWANALTAP